VIRAVTTYVFFRLWLVELVLNELSETFNVTLTSVTLSLVMVLLRFEEFQSTQETMLYRIRSNINKGHIIKYNFMSSQLGKNK